MVSPNNMKLPIMGSQVIRERLPTQIEKLVRRQREITEAFLEGRYVHQLYLACIDERC